MASSSWAALQLHICLEIVCNCRSQRGSDPATGARVPDGGAYQTVRALLAHQAT